MMQKIVLATGNKGKVAELSQLLAPMNFSIVPQTELGIIDADETGLSFIENAIIKARHASLATGLPAIADDSGLAVDALNGAPGIYSARYSGEAATDQSNIDKLLSTLKHLPNAQRTAQFHCVLVYMRHAEDPTPIVCHGVWHGEISQTQAGTSGFGYDPIFFVASEGCTSAELAPARKQQLSHRAQALAQLLNQLQQQG